MIYRILDWKYITSHLSWNNPKRRLQRRVVLLWCVMYFLIQDSLSHGIAPIFKNAVLVLRSTTVHCESQLTVTWNQKFHIVLGCLVNIDSELILVIIDFQRWTCISDSMIKQIGHITFPCFGLGMWKFWVCITGEKNWPICVCICWSQCTSPHSCTSPNTEMEAFRHWLGMKPKHNIFVLKWRKWVSQLNHILSMYLDNATFISMYSFEVFTKYLYKLAVKILRNWLLRFLNIWKQHQIVWTLSQCIKTISYHILNYLSLFRMNQSETHSTYLRSSST